VEVVENAVDTTRMRPPTPSEKAAARRQLGLASDEGPVLLWIGRLHAGKLPQLAVQAAAYWPGVTVIAGDGAERSRLESTITLSQRADDPVRVTLLGHLEDPSPAYRAADVLLFTSGGGGEGFPTTMLEAAAHGLPLVANEDSGAEKIIAAAGGMVCPADPRALAEGAVSVVEEQRGVLARGWAQEHDISAWLDRHERTFEELAG
jgi:UDP-glucose:(heptosyl)LPS alpha-1,3-glucosyltransferase